MKSARGAAHGAAMQTIYFSVTLAMWELYDRLIDGIPGDITVQECAVGSHWIAVRSSEGGLGLAMRIDIETLPPLPGGDYEGRPLKKLAACAKSWNFIEAGYGVAALNAYYNFEKRALSRGIELPDESRKNEAFEKYRAEVTGKKVAVVGHFPYLERLLSPVCELIILERRPQEGDYPDPACEFLLPQQDYAFITGSTMINKTLPRLLSLSKSAKTVLVGPSVTLSPLLFDFGVEDLSGFVVKKPENCLQAVREGDRGAQFEAGTMVNYRKDAGGA
jgi:uncharacterized protein (DUF4213/DUF364 family)